MDRFVAVLKYGTKRSCHPYERGGVLGYRIRGAKNIRSPGQCSALTAADEGPSALPEAPFGTLLTAFVLVLRTWLLERNGLCIVYRLNSRISSF